MDLKAQCPGRIADLTGADARTTNPLSGQGDPLNRAPDFRRSIMMQPAASARPVPHLRALEAKRIEAISHPFATDIERCRGM